MVHLCRQDVKKEGSVHCTEVGIEVFNFTGVSFIRPWLWWTPLSKNLHFWFSAIGYIVLPSSVCLVIRQRMASGAICGILNAQYIAGIYHPHSIRTTMTVLDWLVRGGLGGWNAGENRCWSPHFLQACPLGGLENPLDSLAVCAVYLPGGGKGWWTVTLQIQLIPTLLQPPTYTVTWQWYFCIPPQHWFIKQLASLLNYCLFDNATAKRETL
jgi:hypothetical protein